MVIVYNVLMHKKTKMVVRFSEAAGSPFEWSLGPLWKNLQWYFLWLFELIFSSWTKAFVDIGLSWSDLSYKFSWFKLWARMQVCHLKNHPEKGLPLCIYSLIESIVIINKNKWRKELRDLEGNRRGSWRRWTWAPSLLSTKLRPGSRRTSPRTTAPSSRSQRREDAQRRRNEEEQFEFICLLYLCLFFVCMIS